VDVWEERVDELVAMGALARPERRGSRQEQRLNVDDQNGGQPHALTLAQQQADRNLVRRAWGKPALSDPTPGRETTSA
jgi:hypothetical protein